MKSIFYYETPIGKIGIGDNGKSIICLLFEGQKYSEDLTINETDLIRGAKNQLFEYFDGKRKDFDLPLEYEKGTEFQRKCWNALRTIPYGETRTYKDMANQIGHLKAYRAVGLANNKNSLSIFVPCHRVIGSNGKLVGFGGGLDTKEKLLQLEKANM